MKIAYIVLGMKRSGHHAIVHWIGYNNTPAVHYNDYKIYNDMFIPAHKTEPVYFDGNNNCFITHIYNCEDFNMENFSKLLNLSHWKDYDKTFFILVMRDPYNWIASCLKAGGGLSKKLKYRIQYYMKQYELFINPNDELLPVNFNTWFSSNEYKIYLGKSLGLSSFHKGVNKTSVRGGGSSFDKLKYKNSAQKMDILNRYKEYSKNPIFINIITPKLDEIAKNSFNMKFKVPSI